jgi:hypothetical protein
MTSARVGTGNSRRLRPGELNGVCLPVIRVDGVDYNLEEMQRAQLIELAALLKADSDNIQLQIDGGDSGSWADPRWEAKALYAQKLKRTQVKLIHAQLHRGRLKAGTLGQHFIDEAYRTLPRERFEEIMETAKTSYNLALASS